jgi:uncharacterized protein
MLNSILEFTKIACQKPENVFAPSFFDEHLALVALYANQLCDILKGDQEIVAISAYLHDISAVLDFKTLPSHHIDSAKIAESLLTESKYPPPKIQMVKQAILTHSAPLKIEQESIEAVCVSNADAISQIINPAYWFYFIYTVRQLSFADGKAWYLGRIKSNWNGLIEPARQLIQNQYEAVLHTLA